jgi:hypothetical protein
MAKKAQTKTSARRTSKKADKARVTTKTSARKAATERVVFEHPLDSKIVITKGAEHGKRPGSKKEKAYNLLFKMDGKTPADYLAKGGPRWTLAWAERRQLARYVGGTARTAVKSKTAAKAA